MRNAIRSAGPALIVVIAATAINYLLKNPAGQTAVFVFAGIFASFILALVGGVKKWEKLPWLPWGGICVAAGGYLADNSLLMNAGFFAFTIFMVWHEHQRERPLRELSIAQR